MTAENYCQAVWKERWPSLKSESYKELLYIQKLQMPLSIVPTVNASVGKKSKGIVKFQNWKKEYLWSSMV